MLDFVIIISMLLLQILHYAFMIYSFMILARVLGSWFPSFARSRLMQMIGFYVDPYLHLFRRFIPPLGGVMDLSPLIAFFVLRFVEKISLTLVARWIF